MNNTQLLLICSILSASIFAMESNEEVLWQQLHEVYEEQSDNIAELFFTTLDTKKADTAAFYNAVCTWRALPIARKLLHLQKIHTTINENDVIDFSLYNFGQFIGTKILDTKQTENLVYETYH